MIFYFVISCIFRYSFSAVSLLTAGPFLGFFGGGGAEEVGTFVVVEAAVVEEIVVVRVDTDEEGRFVT